MTEKDKMKVSIVMGSISDWDTMKESANILDKFTIGYEKKIVSAHRSPEYMFEYAKNARDLGIEIIIAGAGGSGQLRRHRDRQPALWPQAGAGDRHDAGA